jgi:transcriptional regulator with XRE-family HTH domain
MAVGDIVQEVDCMAGAPSDTPAVARRRVRLAVRLGRRATGMSQGDVARMLGWSLSKMQRIESGEVAVSGTDLRALLDIYGVADPDEIDRLLEDTRTSRRQRWWTAPEFRQHLTKGTLQLLQFESQAAAIHVYQPHLIPGLLQTPEMAQKVLSWFGDALSGEARRVRYDVRMLRREQVIERDDPPSYFLALDEAVLKRELGGARVAAEQLEALAETARRPRVRVRVVPMAVGGIAALEGPITILDMAEDDPEDAVLYREYDVNDELIHDLEQLRAARTRFMKIWDMAYNEEASLRRISAQAAVLRSSLD